MQDDTQNYVADGGFQNVTHTQIEFHRALETCDPHDLPLNVSISKHTPFTVAWANLFSIKHYAWLSRQFLCLGGFGCSLTDRNGHSVRSNQSRSHNRAAHVNAVRRWRRCRRRRHVSLMQILPDVFVAVDHGQHHGIHGCEISNYGDI